MTFFIQIQINITDRSVKETFQNQLEGVKICGSLGKVKTFKAVFFTAALVCIIKKEAKTGSSMVICYCCHFWGIQEVIQLVKFPTQIRLIVLWIGHLVKTDNIRATLGKDITYTVQVLLVNTL